MKKDSKQTTAIFYFLMIVLFASVGYSINQNINCIREPKNYEKSNVNTFHDSLYNDTLVYPFLKEQK